MDCNLLDGNIGACTDKTSLGFHATALIGNVQDIGTVTYDDSTAIISALTMGSPMFEVYTAGDKPYGEFKISAETKKLGMTFKNDVVLYFKSLTPTSVAQFKALANGQFFMGLRQKGVVGKTAEYVFIGLQAALICSAAEWDAAEGAFKVTLSENMLDLPVLFLSTGTPDALPLITAGSTTATTWANLTL